MSTAEFLDRGVKGGFKAIQEKMKNLKKEVEDLQQTEKDCIAGRDDARKRNGAAFAKMSELTITIGEKEEQLRKSTEKLQYAGGKLDEKEGHVVRVKDWNDSITTVPVEELEELQKHVKVLKDNYLMFKQKVADGRMKINTLEDSIERKDHKLQELVRREDTLRTECEHQQREYELKKKRDSKQHSNTRAVEEKLKEVEAGYHNARRRHETSAAQLVGLEAKISRSEVICEEYKRKRIAIESTLRELLSSYARDRQQAPPPKYPQSEFAVNSATN